MSDESHGHEVIIVKHHGGHEDAHHGGVWKIAFADFMTAMMAFFLVMWLLSANDKTKVTIAKYFNPVELVDSTPQPPGLNDPKKGDPSIVKQSKKPVSTHEGKDGMSPAMAEGGGEAMDNPIGEAEATVVHDEAEILRDPYAVLAEIANKANRQAPEKSKDPKIEEAQRGLGAQGSKGGDAFRDPFDTLQSGLADTPPPTAASPSPSKAEAAANPATPVPAPPVAGGAAPPAPAGAPTPPAAPAAVAASPAVQPGAADDAAATPVPGEDKPLPPAALRARIAALAKPTEMPPGPMPKLDVRQTSEGLLISLTDSADFAMFPLSSARPSGKTVALVEKIGVLLKGQKGSVTVRGFTDSRPFKSDTYDNWRLSATRAQMAHYMLVAGGVSDARFDRIEGYADRRPKNPKVPEAAENRRIEILLRDPTP